VIIFGLRALLFTLNKQTLIDKYDFYQDKDNNRDISNTDQEILSKREENKNPRGSKLKQWFKKKIREISYEFKFNFFLRIAIELFLEVFILSLLNVKYLKINNFYQILSIITSMVLLGLCIIFL